MKRTDDDDDNPSTIELQKIALMSTAQIIRKVLGQITLNSCWDLHVPQDRHKTIGENKFKINI